MTPRTRRGIASVVGALFLAVIFLAAIGAQVYVSGAEADYAHGASSALDRQSVHDREGIDFVGSGQGLTAVDSGPASVTAVAVIMKFENGTFYYLSNSSTPALAPAVLPPSGEAQVQTLIPSGICSPGTASCISKFDSIVGGGAVQGRGVALVTSMGNAFWYYPTASPAGGTAGGAVYRTSSTQSTTSGSMVSLGGLSFQGAPGSFYVVSLDLAYYQSTASAPGVQFGISLPSGSTFLFCGGMFWSYSATASQTGSPGNACTGTVGGSLGTTTSPQTYCTSSTSACEFSGTAYVAFGATAGSFQVTFESTSGGTASVLADSVIAVSQAR